MVKMSKKSEAFLQEYVPEATGFEKVIDILESLYDLIENKGFIDHETGYNEFGREAQMVYDDIFYGNFTD